LQRKITRAVSHIPMLRPAGKVEIRDKKMFRKSEMHCGYALLLVAMEILTQQLFTYLMEKW